MQEKLLFFLFIFLFFNYQLLSPSSNFYQLDKSNRNAVEIENKKIKVAEATNKKLKKNHSVSKRWSVHFLQLSNFSIQKDFYTSSIPQPLISEIFTSNSYYRRFPVSLAVPLSVIEDLFNDIPLFASIVKEISQKNIQTSPVSKEKLHLLNISNSRGHIINYPPTTVNYLFPIHPSKNSSKKRKKQNKI